uniref:NADH-ubiquinone oxidoreductase chain 4L n=1 Tax=Staphylinoidea sp. 5 KM-2017 TaxID=2219459 RepID=A0A346RIN0_9COLE|nr:NADH dehydrogenase subunit 4L [Staphylinoidea sp. 5 KM-2017]
MMVIFTFLYFMGVLSFCLNRKHLLLMLLSLEFVVVNTFLLMGFVLNILNGEAYFLSLFMVMSVCEGALGLAILVSLIRSHGSDYLNTLNLMW